MASIYDLLQPGEQPPQAAPIQGTNQGPQDWAAFLTQLRDNPAALNALFAAGTALMQPIQPGQTNAGALGAAAMQGMGAYNQFGEMQRKAQESEMERGLRQAQTGYYQAQTKKLGAKDAAGWTYDKVGNMPVRIGPDGSMETPGKDGRWIPVSPEAAQAYAKAGAERAPHYITTQGGQVVAASGTEATPVMIGGKPVVAREPADPFATLAATEAMKIKAEERSRAGKIESENRAEQLRRTQEDMETIDAIRVMRDNPMVAMEKPDIAAKALRSFRNPTFATDENLRVQAYVTLKKADQQAVLEGRRDLTDLKGRKWRADPVSGEFKRVK